MALAAALACTPAVHEVHAPVPAVPAVRAPEAEPTGTVPPRVLAPDGDEDGDKLLNASDRCPEEPEDFDGFADDDGCVDRDNDGDGVLDAYAFVDGRWTTCDYIVENGEYVDCRDHAEDRDQFEDEDGCPEVVCTMPGICMGADGERWTLPYDAAGRLDAGKSRIFAAFGESVREYPKIQFRVDIHTDARGAAAKKQTDRVAKEVTALLAGYSVAADRFVIGVHVGAKPVVGGRVASMRTSARRVVLTVTICNWRRPSDPPRSTTPLPGCLLGQQPPTL